LEILNNEDRAERTHKSDSSDWRETERGKMLETLNYLLRKARFQAQRKSLSDEMRLKWVNTMCYITQTCNSVLKDADYDELKREVERTKEEVTQLSEKELGKPEAVTGRDQSKASVSN